MILVVASLYCTTCTVPKDCYLPGLAFNLLSHYRPESIECFIEDQAFLRRQLSHPIPLPPFSRQQFVSLFQSSCAVAPVELTDGRVGGEGVGEEPNHTMARKPGSL